MNGKLDRLSKTIIALGVVSAVSVLFRLWSLFCIAVALSVGAAIWKRILKRKASSESDSTLPASNSAESLRMAPDEIETQITEKIKAQFPNAKWVWAQSDTKRRIENGDEIYVILNGAGGYRRARIGITDRTVSEIAVCLPAARIADDASSVTENSAVTPKKENYELIAFEWVDAHILELNERINEAIGQGNTEFEITAEELPVPESWECVCKELLRAGLTKAERAENGIKIILNNNFT